MHKSFELEVAFQRMSDMFLTGAWGVFEAIRTGKLGPGGCEFGTPTSMQKMSFYRLSVSLVLEVHRVNALRQSGFVIKTWNEAPKEKVFINICQTEAAGKPQKTKISSSSSSNSNEASAGDKSSGQSQWSLPTLINHPRYEKDNSTFCFHPSNMDSILFHF